MPVCRLFGLHGGHRPVSATFWLLEAADSLAVPSRSQPDGYGIGTFEGVEAAIGWVADNVPVFSLNFVLATATDLWAIRYPQTHDLFVLERQAGGQGGCHELEKTSSSGTIHVRSDEMLTCGSVVVATERMDDDPAWRPLRPGELLHVSPDLRCTSSIVADRPPATLLTLDDLDRRAAASQTAETTAVGGRPGSR
jgi:predicted glutamine amidotransferase